MAFEVTNLYLVFMHKILWLQSQYNDPQKMEPLFSYSHFILISQVNVEFFGVCIQENIFDIVWKHLDEYIKYTPKNTFKVV